MHQTPPRGPTARPPLWIVIPGSLLIAFHLGAVLINVLAAPSGPWPSMEGGADMRLPPLVFALARERAATPYLQPMKLTHNYHFTSNRPASPEAFLEVTLRDKEGQELKTIRLPDPQASGRTRAWQQMLVRWLVDDQPVAPKMGEQIPAPGVKIPDVPTWEPVPGEMRQLTLTMVPENLVPRNRPVFRPSDWSLLLVRSYARHLCRVHGAARAEVSRHSREPVPPQMVFEGDGPPPPMEDLVSHYGRLPQ